ARGLADLRDARGRLRAGADHARHRRADKSVVVAKIAMIGWPEPPSREATKGGLMRTRGAHVMVVSLLTLAAVLAGCAKRPATATVAQVPAPTATGVKIEPGPPTTATTPTTAMPAPPGGAAATTP